MSGSNPQMHNRVVQQNTKPQEASRIIFLESISLWKREMRFTSRRSLGRVWKVTFFVLTGLIFTKSNIIICTGTHCTVAIHLLLHNTNYTSDQDVRLSGCVCERSAISQETCQSNLATSWPQWKSGGRGAGLQPETCLQKFRLQCQPATYSF